MNGKQKRGISRLLGNCMLFATSKDYQPPMTDYSGDELSVLIDLLAKQTAVYTKLMSDDFRNEEEFAQTAQDILDLQRAIWLKMGFGKGEEKESDPHR
jgi:hypothetical protein